MTWDPTIPAGTDLVRDGDDVIRELKTDLEVGLTATEGAPLSQDGGVFPGSVPATPKFHYRGLKGITADRPLAPDYGLYFNDTTGALERSNGTIWEVLNLSGSSFPVGTKIPFYQAVAPIGWTIDATLNDRFLRVVSAAGGVTGGAFVNFNHFHTQPNHTHGDGNLHADMIFADSGGNRVFYNTKIATIDTLPSVWGVAGIAPGSTVNTNEFVSVVGSTSSDGNDNTNTVTLTHGSAQHAFADVIICSKD